MSHSKQNSDRSPSSDRIKTNLFFDDFVDCIENLPSRLQLLLSELRNVDVLVKARHRKLHAIKLEIICKNRASDNQDAQRVELDSLLHKMHQILIQCQTLGDQKVRLTGQIIELIGSKTRQLGYDPKTDEAKFHVDIDEEKILNEFRLTCKKNRPIHHHYNAANSSTNSRSSTRQIQNLTKAGHKQTIDLNKKVYNKKGLNSHRDLWHDDNSNQDHSLQNSTNHLNGQMYAKKKPLNQSCASHADPKKSYKKSNDSKSGIDDSNQPSSTRSKRQLNFCKTSNDLAKKSLNQSLKISRKRGLGISKKAHSSGSSTTSHQCKSPSSISSFSSLSSCKNKYLTNNTNNGNQSAKTSSPKDNNQTSNSDKAQKENMKINSKNKLVKRLGVRGRVKSNKSDKTSQENSEYETDDEKSAESDIHDSNGQKNSQIKNEAREDQLERNSNETESIKNLDEEENEPNNQIEEDRPAPRSKRIKQEVDYSDDIRKKSTRIARNNINETVTKISKSAHDEPIYCTCREISYGQMIMCDNDACQIEWFHFNCVKLTSKPKGRWYCPQCRGDTHKVMKKSHLIQSSASSNLSSPSYYASNYSNRLK